jgi:hypothetical protein
LRDRASSPGVGGVLGRRVDLGVALDRVFVRFLERFALVFAAFPPRPTVAVLRIDPHRVGNVLAPQRGAQVCAAVVEDFDGALALAPIRHTGWPMWS